jgi:hypothetical protein
MNRIIATGLLIAAIIAALMTLSGGYYGLFVFVVIPVIVGFFGGSIVKPATPAKAATAGAIAVMIGLGLFLALGLEGAICVLMAAPLAVPLGMLGGWLAYNPAPHNASLTNMMLIIPLSLGSLGFDVAVKPDIFEVRSSIEIAAAPERVWKNVVTFSDLPDPEEWYFKTGIAYPKRARIEGTGPGAIRYCEFSTGPFVEPIQVWDEPRRLQFMVIQNPEPMHEWSPYANVVPKHLHGYLVSKRGQFQLTRLSNGHTLLEGTTWYQHGLWPEQYWRVWSDAIIHRIHMRVLTHIKVLSESPGR